MKAAFTAGAITGSIISIAAYHRLSRTVRRYRNAVAAYRAGKV